ncbi:hypothetical protein [Desulfosporosinus meridiei]|uniref:Uncharacterized protein n=1 Tax=Desulfosporosinus meridiei (strain ATCC BAA-275 / DSM 13257 / KCTC 12902 / NCIMB 13706 / S10) TaxID=768704 RepID=J7J5L4_DESMD|nr:hypothetical protein [Desulfosporosinus meridiei]AFQ46236.1 hypothetical protein Desmer_4430 [Desulfosporosinus meridiei DSM 13257]
MFKIIPHAKKFWIYGAAAAMIIASSSTMVYALNDNIPANASASTALSTAVQTNDQTQPTAPQVTLGYNLVDLSKGSPDPERKQAFKTKLSLNKNLTPEEIEEKYQAVLANTIPGDKDISAEQAAAYAAEILVKAYRVDFTGYTAEASFARSSVPNSDNWTVVFHTSNDDKSAKRYLASVDSVSGALLTASCYNFSYADVISQNPQDPAWEKKALADITQLLPENISIVSSKVIAATPEIGVSVVSSLSDGSAFAVRLTGENKEAATYQYFPGGYDGSWDISPVTVNGVG